jgi:hypothetical protein
MFKLLTYILANFREFPEMSKRRKINFSVELFEKIDVYMNSYLENNNNKRYYLKILDIFKSFVFVVLESNDTNYMKIPTDSRLLKLLQEFNQHQESESLKNKSKHSTREKEKEKEKDKDKEKERHVGKDKDKERHGGKDKEKEKEKRRARHSRVRDEIAKDVKNAAFLNDSISESSVNTDKLVADNDEVQSFFQMNP